MIRLPDADAACQPEEVNIPWRRPPEPEPEPAQTPDEPTDALSAELQALRKEFDVVHLPDGTTRALPALPINVLAIIAEGLIRGVDMHDTRAYDAFIVGVRVGLGGTSQEAKDLAAELKGRRAPED